MITKKIFILMTITLALVGCWEQEVEQKDAQKLDCKNPSNKQEQQECAHEAFIESGAIPDTLPTDSKKWSMHP